MLLTYFIFFIILTWNWIFKVYLQFVSRFFHIVLRIVFDINNNPDNSHFILRIPYCLYKSLLYLNGNSQFSQHLPPLCQSQYDQGLKYGLHYNSYNSYPKYDFAVSGCNVISYEREPSFTTCTGVGVGVGVGDCVGVGVEVGVCVGVGVGVGVGDGDGETSAALERTSSSLPSFSITSYWILLLSPISTCAYDLSKPTYLTLPTISLSTLIVFASEGPMALGMSIIILFFSTFLQYCNSRNCQGLKQLCPFDRQVHRQHKEYCPLTLHLCRCLRGWAKKLQDFRNRCSGYVYNKIFSRFYDFMVQLLLKINHHSCHITALVCTSYGLYQVAFCFNILISPSIYAPDTSITILSGSEE